MSTGGYFMHDGKRVDVEGAPRVRVGDCVAIILDFRTGKMIFDVWGTPALPPLNSHRFVGFQSKDLARTPPVACL